MENTKHLILKKYLDMSYINAILCDSHSQYYNKLNMIVVFPSIVGSAILTCLNSSSIDDNIMKWLNISINGLNTIIITLSTQYKLNDRLVIYKNSYAKFNKLCHKIESILNNSQETTEKQIDEVINEYDGIVSDNCYNYLSSYKKKVINKYSSTRQLPNSLALDHESSIINVDVVNTNISA